MDFSLSLSLSLQPACQPRREKNKEVEEERKKKKEDERRMEKNREKREKEREGRTTVKKKGIYIFIYLFIFQRWKKKREKDFSNFLHRRFPLSLQFFLFLFLSFSLSFSLLRPTIINSENVKHELCWTRFEFENSTWNRRINDQARALPAGGRDNRARGRGLGPISWSRVTEREIVSSAVRIKRSMVQFHMTPNFFLF